MAFLKPIVLFVYHKHREARLLGDRTVPTRTGIFFNGLQSLHLAGPEIQQDGNTGFIGPTSSANGGMQQRRSGLWFEESMQKRREWEVPDIEKSAGCSTTRRQPVFMQRFKDVRRMKKVVAVFACVVGLAVAVQALTGSPLIRRLIVDTAQAAGELILIDDFNDGDISDWSTGGIGSVVASPTFEGDYALKVESISTYSYASKTIASPEEISSISFYVLIDSESAGQLTIFVTDSSNNQAVLASIQSKTFSVFNGFTDSYVNVGSLTDLDTWYHVEFTNIDYDAQTFDVWFDDAEVATDFQFRGWPSMPEAFQKIQFNNPNHNTLGYVDYIQYREKVETVTYEVFLPLIRMDE